MSSSSSSRSSSPASERPPPKTSAKTRGKKRPVADDGGPKNEGEDQNWAYEPPSGAVQLQNPKNLGKFDWDVIEQDEDLEVWLVRVPDAIKPKHLENVSLTLPSDNASSSHVGKLSRKSTDYDVWSVGENADVGGEEVSRLSCLLPRKSTRGELYLAPRPISRRLTISATPATAPHISKPSQNPPRPTYPQDVLTHCFTPYGAGFKQPIVEVDSAMEVDADAPAEVQAQIAPIVKVEKKGKKRKGDAVDSSSPKKAKKAKHKA